MTHSEIKNIAEEYAKSISDKPIDILRMVHYAKEVLEYVSTRYCIVEREKVMEEFNNAESVSKEAADCMSYELMENAEGRREVLNSLFGSEIGKEGE